MKAKRRGPGRPAGGSEQLLKAVLDATLAALIQRGYEQLSLDAIAREVGVHKTTIYRHWSTKSGVVLAALATLREDDPPFVASGKLREDLVTLLAGKARRLSTARGRAIARALMSIGDDATMTAELRAQRFALPSSIVRKAIEHGELASTVDPSFVSEILIAPVVHRVVMLGERADRAFVERVVDQVLAGLPKGHRTRKRSASR